MKLLFFAQPNMILRDEQTKMSKIFVNHSTYKALLGNDEIIVKFSAMCSHRNRRHTSFEMKMLPEWQHTIRFRNVRIDSKII